MTFATGLFFVLFAAMIAITGDSFIKLAADRSAFLSRPMFLGIAFYAVSAVLWYVAMRHISLAQAAVAYSMLTLVALCVIGAVVFDEPLAMRDAAGVGCAIAAMVLMAQPA